MLGPDDRAVSDVIAFVLVFSIIITSVGFVYTVGFGSLNDLQETEQRANAERSMSALAVAMDDVIRERSGDRASDIDLAGETIVVEEAYELEVVVENSSGATTTTTIDNALVYGAGGDTQIVYMGGAVIRIDRDGAVVTRAPKYSCRPGETRAVVSGPSLDDADDQGGLSADGSIRVEAEIDDRLGSTLVFPEAADENGDVDEVRISLTGAPADVESDVEAAWERWFDDQDGWTTGGGSTVGECSFSGNDGTVFVRNGEIDITYII